MAIPVLPLTLVYSLVLWIWQASEGLEATARHAIYGVQWRRLDRELLGLLQDRSRV